MTPASDKIAFVYEALLVAQAAVALTPVMAVIGEAQTKRGYIREFPYTVHSDVKSAATKALREAGLLLVRLSIAPVVVGADGREITITFALTHAATGEQVMLSSTWPVAAVAEQHIDRPQALAATVSTAEKHTLLQLLGIPIEMPTAQAAERRAAEAPGETPSWMDSPPLPGPPQHISTALTVWANRAFRERHAAAPTRAAAAEVEVPGWVDAVAAALGGAPREVVSIEEQQQVCAWILHPSRRSAA